MSPPRVRPGPTPVVAIEPALLDEDRSAEFLSRSRSLLRQLRQEDVARVKRGEEPVGPLWVVIRKSVFYRPADLRRWIDEQAVPRGVVSFDKRVPPTPATGEATWSSSNSTRTGRRAVNLRGGAPVPPRSRP